MAGPGNAPYWVHGRPHRCQCRGPRSPIERNSDDPTRRRSTGEHDQCGPAVSRLQPEKRRAGFLDVLFGTTLGGRPEGDRSRMIRTADENQSLGQAPHRCTVDLCLFHSGVPQASACFAASACIRRGGTSRTAQLARHSVPGRHGCRRQEDSSPDIVASSSGCVAGKWPLGIDLSPYKLHRIHVRSLGQSRSNPRESRLASGERCEGAGG